MHTVLGQQARQSFSFSYSSAMTGCASTSVSRGNLRMENDASTRELLDLIKRLKQLALGVAVDGFLVPLSVSSFNPRPRLAAFL
mgnify:CR=1 FL=1